MTKTRTMVFGAAQSSASVLISMVALLVVGKVMTNAPGLSLEMVAHFVLVQTSADFLILLFGFGLPHALPKLVAASLAQEQKTLIRSAWTVQGLVGLLVSAVLLLVYAGVSGTELLPGTWHPYFPLLPLVPGLFMVGLLRDLLLAAMAGRNAYGYRAMAIVLMSVVQVGLVVIFLLGMKGELNHLVAAFVGAYAMGTLWLFSRMGPLCRPGMDWKVYFAALRFSFPLYLNSLMTFTYLRFDLFLVAKYVGIVEAGIYEIVRRIPSILSRVVNSLLVPYLPTMSTLLAENKRAEATALLNRSLGIIALLCYGGTFAAISLGDNLVRLLFSEAYLPGVAVMAYLLFAISLAIQAGVLSHTLTAMNKPRAVTWANGISMLVSVGLNLVLLPTLGMAGAGMAAIAAGAVSYLLQGLMVHRQGLNLNALHCAITQILAVLSFMLIHQVSGTMLQIILTLGFVAALFLFRVVQVEDLKKTAQILRRP